MIESEYGKAALNRTVYCVFYCFAWNMLIVVVCARMKLDD